MKQNPEQMLAKRKKRHVSANSLRGLLFHLQVKAGHLDARIRGVERSLEQLHHRDQKIPLGPRDVTVAPWD